MLPKIILSLTLVTLLFAGAILTQNASVRGQSKSNNANGSVNFGGVASNSNSMLIPKKHRRNTKSCRLVSLKDAEGIYRAPMEFSDERDNEEHFRSCDYQTYRNFGQDRFPDWIFIRSTKYETIQKAKDILRLELEISKLNEIVNGEDFHFDYQILKSIGDGAWMKSRKSSQQIYVRKGKSVLTIQTTRRLKDSSQKLKRVAQKAAGKL